MKKTILLLITSMLFGCYAKREHINKLDGSQISKSELTIKIQSLIEVANVAGISTTIFNNNKTVYQKSFGYANLETKDTLTAKNVFYSASLSKAVFGYLVAQLVVDGVIDLDKPLYEYLDKPLPEYEFGNERKSYKDLANDKRYEKITARMCLSHTTGFPNWRWMTRESDFFREGKIRFLIDPDTRYYYSGEGIQLLQFVIEKITNKNLEELAQEKVFQPLHMDMTSYVWKEKFNNKYCNGHTSNGVVIAKDRRDRANAAGSMETTTEDYSKFIQHLLEQTEIKSEVTNLLYESNIRITSKTQFGYQAWQDIDENDSIELSYGLGWGLLKSPFGKGMFKEGHGEGFQHYSIIFPDKDIGIIILSNSDNAESIFKELLEITIGDTYTPWQWERYIPYNHRK
ncbi:serine hydrolase [uncultured Polaribacter sp.]|uniref:serine hydrolase domain-containing protein n=1 Tax=uncultured Polaribacter sp. TaxID=174711 RepID=UPI0026116F4B|nr:serine hydrolase domain-containing protein [uncultured Polaribacter sp.]